MPVAYRNTRSGRVVHMAEALASMDRSKRWEMIEPGGEVAAPGEASGVEVRAGSTPAGTTSPPPPSPFDPSEHTVTQVNEYLAAVEVAERERVLQAEAEGRARRGITSGPHSDLSGA